MIKYKGRVRKGKVKMPKKPIIKEGFKVWYRCYCCGYLCTFRLYKGKLVNPLTGKKQRETGLVRKVVMDLLEPFVNT